MLGKAEVCKSHIFPKVAGVSKSLPPVAYTKAIGENMLLKAFYLKQKRCERLINIFFRQTYGTVPVSSSSSLPSSNLPLSTMLQGEDGNMVSLLGRLLKFIK